MREADAIHKVLARYLERLRTAIVRSPLLDASPGNIVGRGKKLDLYHLNRFRPGLADDLLDAILEAKEPEGNKRTRRHGSIVIAPDLEFLDLAHEPGADDDDEDRAVAIERIYRQIDRNLIREAQKIQRETGNRCLWLGYPILYYMERTPPNRSILAPLLLWPIRAQLEPSREMAVRIEREWAADGPLPNTLMAAWLKQHSNLELFPSSVEDIPRDRARLDDWLKLRLRAIDGLSSAALTAPLAAMPRKTMLDRADSPALFNSAVLGIMRWQFQSMMADLEALLKFRQYDDVFTSFTTGRSLIHDKRPSFENERDRHHVIEADFSQEKAILLARDGPGVVVQGPPGTGKSQTITNMIADEVARGGFVLVVCQKRAALDVVAKNLNQAGLEDLYLLIHDAAADREQTIRMLRDQIESLRTQVPQRDPESKRCALADAIDQIEQEFDSLFGALHAEQPCGLSFQRIMHELLGLADQHPNLRADRVLSSGLANINHAELERMVGLMNRAGELYAAVHPADNAWTQRRRDFVLTPASRRDVDDWTIACLQADETHARFIADRGHGLGIDPDPDQFLTAGTRIARALDQVLDGNAQGILGWYAAGRKSAALPAKLQELTELAERVKTTALDPKLDKVIPRHDAAQAVELIARLKEMLDYRRRPFRWLSRRYRAVRRHLREAVGRAPAMSGWGAVAATRDLLRARLDRHLLHEGVRALGQRPEDGADAAALKAVHRLSSWQAWIDRFVQLAAQFPEASTALAAMSKVDCSAVRAWREKLQIALERSAVLRPLLAELARASEFLEPAAVEALAGRARLGELVRERVTAIRDDLGQLGRLQEYERLAREMRAVPKEAEVFERLVREHTPADSPIALDERWSAVVRLSAFQAWRLHAVEGNPDLELIHSPSIEDRRDELAEKLRAKRAIEPKGISASLAAERAEAARSRLWSRLLHLRGRGAKRLREILHEGLGLRLRWLRPCWLTNPETASQVLPLTQGMFDLVIFDEASQLPIEQAMPAIFRGRRIVVAGDEQQLPPTSFFRTAVDEVSVDDLDETDTDEQDADAGGGPRVDRSGLDLALNCEDLLELSDGVLPPHLLEVHYRSRYPALIEYSNWAHYGGRLHAATPAWDPGSREAAPIQVHRVDGVYSSRINVDEAEYVIKLLEELWKSPQPPTVGVVTFNKEQEARIDETIARQSQFSDDFRALVEREIGRTEDRKDVGFFVKNLEAVQGDERDIMIFSTTFGPSQRGMPETFRRTFGPLTQTGGERRLNVAVTRARKAVLVVTSMPFDRVSDCAAGIEPGRRIKARDFLQVYLEYARSISDGVPDAVSFWLSQAAKLGQALREPYRAPGGVEFDSVFEEQVYERLTKLGWNVDTQVGQREFRIDLAVRHPQPDLGYILGIECDGATYHSGRTARSYDLWRQDILEDYGWRIYRIWSTRWWTHADEVLDHLQGVLERRVAEIREPTVPLPIARKPVPPEPIVERAEAVEAEEEIVEAPQPTALAGAAAWPERLGHVIEDSSIGESEIAEWHDPHGLPWSLRVDRKGAKRMLRLLCKTEVTRHFSLKPAAVDRDRDLIEQLADVASHEDVLRWFRKYQMHLYPPEAD